MEEMYSLICNVMDLAILTNTGFQELSAPCKLAISENAVKCACLKIVADVWQCANNCMVQPIAINFPVYAN